MDDTVLTWLSFRSDQNFTLMFLKIFEALSLCDHSDGIVVTQITITFFFQKFFFSKCPSDYPDVLENYPASPPKCYGRFSLVITHFRGWDLIPI